MRLVLSAALLVDGTSSPNCFRVVGTSLAAPLWAGIWTLANEAQIDATGGPAGSAANGFFYSIPNAFHKASSMTGTGNGFAHVGLGSHVTNQRRLLSEDRQCRLGILNIRRVNSGFRD